MEQFFDESGKATAVTVISAMPMTVTQIKNKEKDGYDAVVFGYGQKKLDKMSKPQKGALKKSLGEKATGFKYLREWRLSTGNDSKLNVGDVVDLSLIDEGEKVVVSSISKGKGFQGVVKRYGFKGGPRSHGQKHSEREPGSLSAGGMQRVVKDKRMPGRMGSDRMTFKNLKVIKVDKDSNTLLIKGAVAGRRGTLVEIYN